MESEWGLKERELRYLYTGERYRTLAGTKPAIMARIVCMPEFVKNIRLSEACPEDEVTVEIGIHDLFIPQNQGAWIWKLNKSGSEIIQESRFIAKGKMEVFTIAELTQWLFGYALPSRWKTFLTASISSRSTEFFWTRWFRGRSGAGGIHFGCSAGGKECQR